jgi:hypothetical protein
VVSDNIRIVFFLACLAVGPALLGFVVGKPLWFTQGQAQGQAQMRQEAIDAGVGQWVVDPKTGITEFRFGR